MNMYFYYYFILLKTFQIIYFGTIDLIGHFFFSFN